MKMSLPLLATSMLMLSGCVPSIGLLAAGFVEGNSFDSFDEPQAIGYFDGTVWDAPVEGPADIYVYEGWGLDITGTTRNNDNGRSGMMMIYSEQTLADIVDGGSRPLDDAEVLLCGERGWNAYDEPADEAEVEVEEDENGNVVVLFRGEANNGQRFQELSFVLDAETLTPVAP